jgi:GNAT superfamily N-acetyltransferase
MLAGKGYRIKDPVTLYAAPIDRIATHRPPPVTTFEVWPALAIQADIWAEGGIGSERMAVMERADCPKTTILGRINDTPAGTAYVGISNGIAMFHALEVAQRFRRRGLAAHMIRAMAFWARENGAKHFALVVTEANVGANALYASLGFDVVGHYHYRILPE